MAKYRKKPVVIEAFQMTPARRADNSEWPQWMHQAWNKNAGQPGALLNQIEGSSDGPLCIETLEGRMKVNWNDFIIRGVKGELYPVRDDIFRETYEEVQLTDCMEE